MSENVTEDDMFASKPAMPYNGSDRGPKSPQANRSYSARRQSLLKVLLEQSGPTGATAKEAVTYLKANGDPGAYHGNTSGALSVMHKEGQIDRLTSRRDRFLVYVLPEHVEGRETQAHGSATTKGQEVLGFKMKADTSGAEAQIARLTAERDEANALFDQQRDRLANVQTERDNLMEAGLSLQIERDEAKQALSNVRDTVDTLRNENQQFLSTVDAQHSEIEVLTDKNHELTQNLLRVNGEVGELRTERDRLEFENLNLTASPAPAARPRKSLTPDEQALATAVLRKIQNTPDGSKDAPSIIPTRVKTMRSLAAALLRVTSVD